MTEGERPRGGERRSAVRWLAPILIACVVSTGCGGGSGGQRATFQGLGLLFDEPGSSTRAFGISADGSTVVGAASSVISLEAFRWTKTGGLQGLGFPGGKEQSEAIAANEDGSVIAGTGKGFAGTGPQAARWIENGGWRFIPDGETFLTIQSRGISADGNTVVGAAQFFGGILQEGFVWTPSGGSQLVGQIAEDQPTVATGISADGTIICGFGTAGDGDQLAFRHTMQDGLVVLPLVPGADDCSGLGISADGGTIVGACDPNGAPTQAVLWDERGAVPLGFLPGGIGSLLRAVSADGAVGVGQAGDADGFGRAVIWTESQGMRDLREVLVGLGLEAALDGWSLTAANAISADGRVIAGFGTDPDENQQAFVATLPARALE